MSIWFKTSLRIEDVASFDMNTMRDYIGIEFTELGENYLKGRMPVDHRTKQPYGFLHGGASVVLAETLGSMASAMVIDQANFYCVGIEVNANHVRSAGEGYVYGTATPLHIGRTTHVWEIKIIDEREKLICASRLTVAIINKK